MKLNFRLSVKFRAFGVTFGSLLRGGWISVDPISGLRWTLADAADAPADARTIVGERGVLFQVWS